MARLLIVGVCKYLAPYGDMSYPATKADLTFLALELLHPRDYLKINIPHKTLDA